MATTRRKAFVAAQWLLALATVWYAFAALRGQLETAGDKLRSISLDWAWILVATAIVGGTYLLLIETWRRIITDSGQSLSFADAARIWFVSNLGKYVPGKIWSISAMAVMAREKNVSAGVAAGSSLMVQLISIAAGIGVVLVTGAQAIDDRRAAMVIAIAIVTALACIPFFLPRLARSAATLVGREIPVPAISQRAVWICLAASIASWFLYGLAFQFFVRGTVGNAAGATSSYIAVYAASYIIGFLALFAPGGAVVRESAIVAGMIKLGLAGQADALAVAIASRIWLTITEIIPGLSYMAFGKRKGT